MLHALQVQRGTPCQIMTLVFYLGSKLRNHITCSRVCVECGHLAHLYPHDASTPEQALRMLLHARALEHIIERVRALNLARRRGGKEAAAASLLAMFYVAVVLRQGRRPDIVCRRNGHNVRVLRALAAIIDRPYYPSWLTPNGHVNCLLGFAKIGPRMARTRELVQTWGKYVHTKYSQKNLDASKPSS